MDLLYWKLGPRRFREGGDGGDGDGDGASGGANGDGSGGGGNGPGGNGGPGDGTGDGSTGGADGVGDGVSGDGEGGVSGNDSDGFGMGIGMDADFGIADFGMDYGIPDVASYDMSLGIPSLAETTVTAENESAPDWGGVASNIGLRGLGAVTGVPVGLIKGLAAVMRGQTATPTQVSLINSIMSLSPLGPINGIMGLMGLPTVGTAVAGLPGVDASSVGPGPSGASQETWGRGGNLDPNSGVEHLVGPDGQSGFGLTSLFGSGLTAGALLGQNDNLGALWRSMKVNNQVVDDGFLKKLMGGS